MPLESVMQRYVAFQSNIYVQLPHSKGIACPAYPNRREITPLSQEYIYFFENFVMLTKNIY